jgi:hypothetical protein
MKRAAFAFAGLSGIAASNVGNPTDLYVNCATGSDTQGDGSQGNPWLTPTAARNAIRKAQPLQNSVTVHVTGGDCYPRDGTGAVSYAHAVLNLYGQQDSGSPNAQITWSGENGARLLAGTSITGFSGTGPVYSAPLPAAVQAFGVGDLAVNGGLGTCINDQAELFFSSTPGADLDAMILARYPNIMSNGTWAWLNIVDVLNETSAFTSNDTHVAAWASEQEPWVHGFWSFDWADSYVPLGSVVAGPKAGEYTLNMRNGTSPLYGFLPQARFMAVNTMVDVDAPGEYFIDKKNNVVAFYPPVTGATLGADLPAHLHAPVNAAPADGSVFLSMSAYVIAMGVTPDDLTVANFRDFVPSGADMLENKLPRASSLQSGDGATVSFVTVTGFDVQLSRGVGILASDCNNCTFTNLDISNQGHNGLSLGGNNNSVTNVRITGTGCAASSVYGGNPTTLTPAGNSVTNSEFANYARMVRTYNPGIGWSGVGNYYAFNYIHDAPHNGMLGGGNDNLFEGNTFKDLCFEATDSGAWYAGRSWIMRGNVLLNNTFVDILNHERMTLGWPSVQAIYLDDELSGTHLINNTCVNVDTCIVIGGGRDTLVSGNTCVNATLCVHLDDRGLNWQADSCAYNSSYTGILPQQLFSVNYTVAPYATAYPEIVKTLAYHPCTPVNATIVNNQYCNCATGFIDADSNSTTSWLDYVSNNNEFAC